MSLFYDVTLRDGNHALRHKLSASAVSDYCRIADKSGVWAVEVGHGNGLGASSFLVGKSDSTDRDLLESARESLKNTKLAVHSIPGFSTIKRDLIPAIEIGVDIFRVATHVTEANTAEKHIEFLASKDVIVHGVLMMSHMTTIENLIIQAGRMLTYGASAVILMDSAGYFLPRDAEIRVKAIIDSLGIEVGFHAHNNLGMGVANANTAINAGASIIDGASMGLGAGAGNAQLEAIIANQIRDKHSNLNIEPFLSMSEKINQSYADSLPRITKSSIESGMAGVFSGYAPHVKEIAQEFGVNTSKIWDEMARRNLVAGQESMIREIAQDLMNL
jgi:4-hydroxy 2-oxovalerate aldolase